MARDKRSKLLQAAVSLSFERGFGNTSIADIAAAAKVPVGNVYYYFKTKDEIGEAIVAQRLAEFDALRQLWEQSEAPKVRLAACVQTTFDNRFQLAKGGCPIGTLCTELQKLDGPLGKASEVLISRLLGWIEAQFEVAGRKADARALAVHLLSGLQGASVLAHALRDPGVVETETKRLKAWIRDL